MGRLLLDCSQTTKPAGLADTEPAAIGLDKGTETRDTSQLRRTQSGRRERGLGHSKSGGWRSWRYR